MTAERHHHHDNPCCRSNITQSLFQPSQLPYNNKQSQQVATDSSHEAVSQITQSLYIRLG